MTSQEEWLARLLAAFGGDLTGWVWTGEVRIDPDAKSKCACGQHGLMYLFPWRKEGMDEVITGSVCVVTLPGIPPEQQERVRAEVARRAEEDRQLKAEIRHAEEMATERALVDELRMLSDRVRDHASLVKERHRKAEPLTPEDARLLSNEYQHDLSEEIRVAIRGLGSNGRLMKTTSKRIHRMLVMKGKLLRHLGTEVPAHG